MDVSSVKRLLVSGYIWAFSGRLITAIAGMLVNAFLARLLMPEELGVYFLVVSMVTVVSLLSMLGQQRAIIPVVSGALAHEDNGRACRAVLLSFVLVVAASVLAAVLLVWQGGMLLGELFGSTTLPSIMWLAAALLVVRSLSSMFAETFRAFHDIRSAVFFNGAFVNVCFALVLGGLLFVDNESTLYEVMILSVGVYALNVGVAWGKSRNWCKGIVCDSDIDVAELLNIGLPLMVTGLTMFAITQADIWIIGSILDEQAVAMYGAAVKLVQLVAIPLMITNAVLPSIVSSLHVKGDLVVMEKILRTAAMVAGVPAAIMLFVIVTNSTQILELVYGEYYRDGAGVLVIVSMGQLVNVVAGAGLIVLMVVGLQVYAMVVSMLSGIVLIAGSVFAATEYGIEGVATVVAITLAVQAVAVLLIVRAKVGVWAHVGFGSVNALIRYLREVKDN